MCYIKRKEREEVVNIRYQHQVEKSRHQDRNSEHGQEAKKCLVTGTGKFSKHLVREGDGNLRTQAEAGEGEVRSVCGGRRDWNMCNCSRGSSTAEGETANTEVKSLRSQEGVMA